MKFVTVLSLSLCFVGVSNLLAQEASQSDWLSEEEQLRHWHEERQELREHLFEEVEPNLIEEDVQRLRRNVMRLGTYRPEWFKDAHQFLIANATLAELYLYEHLLIENPRLRRKIRETLLKFEEIQYPFAPLAFSEYFGEEPEEKQRTLLFFESVLEKAPQAWPEYLEFVLGPWGEDLESQEILRFSSKGCRHWRQHSLKARRLLDYWSDHVQRFWGRVFVKDLDMCLEGA